MDQRIKLNLHKYKTAGMQQFNIDRLSDDDDADDYDDQSSLSSVSDDEFSESESSYQDTTGSTGPSEATTDEMQWESKRGPVCGIAGLRLKSSMLKNCADARADIAQGRQPRPIWDVPETTTYSAATGLYSQIRRGEGPSSRPRDKPVVPRRFPKMGVGSSDLSAIEEMSPLQSSTYSSSSEGPRMSSFRNPSGWNPQHTSTTTSFQPLLPLRPSTSSNRNNGNGGFKVPMSPSPMLCSTPRTEKMFRKNPKYGRHHGSALTLSESRDEGSSSQSSDRAVTPDPWMLEGSENRNPNKSDERIHLPAKAKVWLPEHFGLDNAFAKNKDIRGIIFLSISLCGRRLTLNIQDAAYFRKPSQSSTVTSYVSGLLFHRPSSSSSKSKPDEVYRTRYIPNSSSPSFDEIMHFTLAENCARDSLIVTIYEIEEVHGQKKRVLGCMTFPVNRILKKASVLYGDTFHHRGRRQPVEDVEICNEGFFLLNRDEGSKQNFPQRKVRRQTFYEDPAFTGYTSSAGSSVVSSQVQTVIRVY